MNRAKIEDVLIKMGVPAGIKGFNYIVDAIEIFDERGTGISITKELYPAIAKKNSTTPSRVERAIRHAFEVARSCKGDYEVVNHYIGFMNCENSSSLAMLYKRAKQEFESEHGEVTEEEMDRSKNEIKINAPEIRMIIRQELRTILDELKEVKT